MGFSIDSCCVSSEDAVCHVLMFRCCWRARAPAREHELSRVDVISRSTIYVELCEQQSCACKNDRHDHDLIGVSTKFKRSNAFHLLSVSVPSSAGGHPALNPRRQTLNPRRQTLNFKSNIRVVLHLLHSSTRPAPAAKKKRPRPPQLPPLPYRLRSSCSPSPKRLPRSIVFECRC